MNDSTQRFRWPTHHGDVCCTVEQAAGWLDCLTEMALTGDADALAALAGAVQHFLDAHRQAGAPR